MGCISSKTDINDLHHNIFQVMNVDERGNRLNPGQLEITETDLVLHQRRKAPVKWPLRCLRRYGFDAELFSFESGRRCPTGPGIYAFRCQRAEQLFNLLQTHIQVRNNGGEDAISREFPLPSASGPAVALRGNASGETSYLDPAPSRVCSRIVPGSLQFSTQNGMTTTRLDSVGSSGPLSPQGTASPSPPPIPISSTAVVSSMSSSNPSMHYANEELFSTTTVTTDNSENNNKVLPQSFPSNTAVISLPTDNAVKEKPVSRLSVGSGDGVALMGSVDTSVVMASYVNVNLSNCPLSPTYSAEEDPNYAHLELPTDTHPVYMNIIPGPENGRIGTSEVSASVRAKPPLPVFGTLPISQDWDVDESKRCYANLQPGEIEVPCSYPKHLTGNERILPMSPPASQSQQLPSLTNIQRQVNYIVLDLEQCKSELTNTNCTSQQQPTSPISSVSPTLLTLPSESPHRVSEGYATIDFNKTVALSHSVNRSMDNDNDGSRKTRHNSTINDLYAPPTRHSSSE